MKQQSMLERLKSDEWIKNGWTTMNNWETEFKKNTQK